MEPKELREYRYKLGVLTREGKKVKPVSQQKFAAILDVSLSYYEKMERGKRVIPENVKEILDTHFRLSMEEEANMRVMIDYLRLSFFDATPNQIITQVLRMDEASFETRPTGLYLFDRVSVCGNIWVFWHAKKTNRNVLIQFSGQGCREYEQLLNEKVIDWQEFLSEIWKKQGKLESSYSRVQCSRIDLAIDELWTREDAEYFNLFTILEKRQLGLINDQFKTFEHYSGLVSDEDGRTRSKGLSLYFGSRKSPLFFNFYEKRFELANKEGISVDEALLKHEIYNRYEVRCSAERAMEVVRYFISGKYLGKIGAGIINSKLIVYDLLDEETKIVNERWAKMFRTVSELNFSMNAKEFSIERSERWFETQVAPTLKMLQKKDEVEGRNYLARTVDNAKLSKDQENYIAWFQSIGKV
ncbi:replication initiation factor domain-containing protein [Candidatus Enterococcus murrayae]|uniref:Replication initiation factor domain-containing protein n=1 Tax=Candidatus Enterococcus murrayae TaxID=2815321 RepID=A0ABS3HNN0_9ENTE|nr:replication initiation factor domain-containing protein [Enterococcus sp. MJM16]MBO0455066.1 replication initiation factor domain-containing protein [Enterococcus sp. MJM16]